MRRILLIVGAVLVGALAVVTAAMASGSRTIIGVPSVPAQPAAAVSYLPAAGATGTDPAAPARVSVIDGTLETVTLTGPAGLRASQRNI